MVNSRDIKDLHPTLQRGAKEFLKRCEAIGLKILITSTFRDNEYQNFLYNKVPKVTNSKGGQSIHNFKLAFDICKNIKGQEFNDINFFNKAGSIWKAMGGIWGGDCWSNFIDRPHFQFLGKFTDNEIINGKMISSDEKMKWELEIKENNYMIEPKKMLFKGKQIVLNSILFRDKNYIELRDLEKLGYKINYDEKNKMPTID